MYNCEGATFSFDPWVGQHKQLYKDENENLFLWAASMLESVQEFNAFEDLDVTYH